MSNGDGSKKIQQFEELKRRQLEELRAFEEKQLKELEDFERRGSENQHDHDHGHDEDRDKVFEIRIDRTEFKVREKFLTGLQLRALPNPAIGPERDLFEVVPGGSDEKVNDDKKVKMKDGLRFFTAPAQINPGS